LAARDTLEHHLGNIERKIDRAVKAVIDGQITREETDRYLPAFARGIVRNLSAASA
jgi:hypothetical protein